MSPPQANQPLPPGHQLENYRIERQLSLGGFSIVYLAFDTENNPVAIKEYLPNSLALRSEGDAEYLEVVTPAYPSPISYRGHYYQRSGSTLQDRWLLLQARVSDSLQTLANRYYQPAVEYAITWRYATLAMGIVVLAITASLFISGRMTFQFFPPVEGTHLYAALTMPEGSPIEATSSMSPLPSRLSAPLASMIVRESVFEDTWNVRRVGKLALMIPVSTSTEGRWVARIR